MSALIRDWLLDPLALLFLLAVCGGLVGQWRMRRGSRRGEARRKRSSAPGALRRAAPWLLWIACFLVASAPVVVNPLVAAVEDRYPEDASCPTGGVIVVLGGGVDSRVARVDEVERMRPATFARTVAGERLALADPGVSLVLSGGGLGGDVTRVAEADVMANFLESRGMPRSRLVREGLSGDTASNAREVARLVSAADPPVRLVTSALHMPRALATFEAAGVEACPVAVDRLAIPDIPIWAWMPQVTALVKFDALLHELAATVLYRLRGDL